MLEQLVVPIRRKERQVLGPVVRGVVVQVMYRLRPKEASPQGLRHYKPVFPDVPVLAGHRKELDRAPNVLHRTVVPVL